MPEQENVEENCEILSPGQEEAILLMTPWQLWLSAENFHKPKPTRRLVTSEYFSRHHQWDLVIQNKTKQTS